MTRIADRAAAAAPKRPPLSLAAAAAIFAALAASAPAPAPAQQADELDALVRRSGVVGLPDRTIDLGARAARRHAIVIGNGDYDTAPDLPNAVADAALVAAFLREAGYSVIERHDLDRRGFEDLLRQALFEIDADSEVVFYYAGHGMQIGSRNYLAPVDAALNAAEDAAFETVTLDTILAILGARARSQTVILDSCRDNPFADRKALTELAHAAQSTRAGFSPMSAPVNTLLSFSTSPGALALDGDGANSPFTSALVEVAREAPAETVTSVLEKVRRLVYARTDGRQVPWESSTLVEPMRFGGGGEGIVVAAASGESPGGVTRSLAPVSNAAVATTSAAGAPGADAPADLRLAARLEREVSLGPAVRTALKLAENGTARIAAAPAHGSLVVRGADGAYREATGALDAEAVDGLRYVPRAGQTPASEWDGAIADAFVVAGEGGAEKRIALHLTANACDFEAGDHLDPEGVGIVRYPNEIRPEIALAACEAAVTRAPENGRFRYQLGRARLALRDFAGAREAFEASRDRGHTRAWHALGDLEAEAPSAAGGVADAKSSDAALAYYAMGVDEGDPYAFYALGKQLLRHEESEQLRRQGFDLMTRAVEVGHTFAMNELGWFFLNADGAYHDPARGLRYLRESAARGDIYGFHNLGLVHLSGLGGEKKDAAKAADWFVRAAEGGHPRAPAALGRLHFSGALGRADAAEAIRWYDIGLERGDPWGGANAAWIIANKRPRGFGPAEAAIRAAKAASLRDPDAAASAAAVLRGLPEREIDRAAQMLLAAMGEKIHPDGDFGPGSSASAARVAKRLGEPAPDGAPADRLVTLASLYWRETGFRVDLY